MKIFLRIAMLVFSVTLFIVALWPRSNDGTAAGEAILSDALPTPAPIREAEPTPTPRIQGIVRDVTGGAAINAGVKAKEKLSEIQSIREEQSDQLDAFSSELRQKPSAE
jgi:hypothetical protein